jgi:hypothetical protein
MHLRELGEKLGGGDELLRAVLPIARHYFNRGDPLRALAAAKRSLQLTEATHDPSLLAEVRIMVGTLAYSCGSLREASSHLEGASVNVEQTNPRFSIGPFRQRIIFPCLRALPMQLLGRVDEAVKLVDEGVRRAYESKHLFGLSFA